MAKHDTVAHIAAGTLDTRSGSVEDCPACRNIREMAEEDIELYHMVKGDGTCIVSMNGQGHFPCNLHFTHRDGKQCERVTDQDPWMCKRHPDGVWECRRSHEPMGE